MIKVDFFRPVEIEQEGMKQELTFIECKCIKSANSYSMMIYVTERLYFPVNFTNIKHISEL